MEENQLENSKSIFLIESGASKLEKENIEDERNDKSNIESKLIYKVKQVSLFKLICHLSGKLEIFLMIIAVFSTIFSGSSYALWGLLLGDTINDL